MAEDCDKTAAAGKGADVEKASSKHASPAPQQKSAASPNKAATGGTGKRIFIEKCLSGYLY